LTSTIDILIYRIDLAYLLQLFCVVGRI